MLKRKICLYCKIPVSVFSFKNILRQMVTEYGNVTKTLFVENIVHK